MRLLALLLLATAQVPAGRVVDLSYAFDDKTPYWPSKPPMHFQLDTMYCGPAPFGFFCMKKMAAPEHGGTHMDAPLHFAKGHPSIDKIPLEQLMGPAVVIDLPHATADAALTAADVIALEGAHGAIEAGTIVLVRTGWAAHAHDLKKYYGTENLDDDSNLHFPGVAEDAAKLLVARKIAAIGIDGPGLDVGQAKAFPVHRTLLGADVPQLENLASLAELPARGAYLIALPMKIAGGTGAPARVIAIIPASAARTP
jgi:kynurenine formamidase